MSRRDTPEVRQRRGSAEPRPNRCGRQLALTNPPRYCCLRKLVGRDACKLHGGRSLRGEDAPGYKDGRTSRWAALPPQLLDRFEQSLADERLLDLQPDIALLDAMVWKACESMGEATREQFKTALAAYRELQAARTTPTVNAAMAKLGAALTAGHTVTQALEDTSRLIERKAKVVKTHQQMQIDAGDLMPTRRVSLLLGLMANLVREYIPDVEQRREFGRRYAGLLSPRLRPAGDAAGAVDAEPAQPVIDPNLT